MLNRYVKTILITLSVSCASLSAASQGDSPKQELVVANPLSLSKSWWESYDQPLDQLRDQVAKTKVELDNLKSTLTAEEHKSILQEIDHLAFNFDHYLKQKERETHKEPPQLLLLKEYTIEDLAAVNKSYQSSIMKLSHLKTKVESDKKKLGRIKSKLDNQVIAYQKAPASSILRLEVGVKIMSLRLQQAVMEKELELSKSKVQFLEQETKHLEEELSFAQKNIVLTDSFQDELRQKIDESYIAYEDSLQQLDSARERAFYEEQNNFDDELLCCLWDYKVLKKTVKAELSKVQLKINELQLMLFDQISESEKSSLSEVQKEMKPYYEEIAEAEANITQWEAVLKQEQTHISKQVDITINEDLAGKELIKDQIVDISMEINQVQANIEKMKLLINQLRFLLNEITTSMIKHKSFHETWYLMIEKQVQSTYEWMTGILNFSVFKLQHQPITVSNIVGAILIVVGAMLFALIHKRYVYTNKSVFRNLNRSTKYIVTRCVNYTCFILGILIALSYIGFDFTNFVIIAGALGVGIGFGLQTVVNNIFSGFLLLFQRNIKVGDIVELESKWIGRVCEINLQNTRIHSFEGIDLIVPNNQLTSQTLNNWTLNDNVRRFRVPFHVDLGVDKEKVKEIVLEVTENIHAVKKKDARYDNPQLWIKNFGEYGIEFELVVWVDLTIPMPRGIASATLLWEVETALESHGISISYPRRNLFVQDNKSNEQTLNPSCHSLS